MFDHAREAVDLAKALQAEAPKTYVPPSDGTRPETQQILPHAIVQNTRGYIERVCFQINGCYEKGWFDACAAFTASLLILSIAVSPTIFASFPSSITALKCLLMSAILTAL